MLVSEIFSSFLEDGVGSRGKKSYQKLDIRWRGIELVAYLGPLTSAARVIFRGYVLNIADMFEM